MKKSTLFILIITITMLTVNPIYAAPAENEAKGKSSAGGQGTETAYKIEPGDILRIVTWKEPDFTLDQVLVRIDGKISFPLLNDVQAAGLTPLMMKEVVERELKAFVSNPVVTVTVVTPASKKFYVLGEVQHTGEYDLVKDLTVLQAFALAGGFTQWASKKEIILLRREKGKKIVFKINYKDLARGKNLEQNILIKANDTIIVP